MLMVISLYRMENRHDSLFMWRKTTMIGQNEKEPFLDSKWGAIVLLVAMIVCVIVSAIAG